MSDTLNQRRANVQTQLSGGAMIAQENKIIIAIHAALCNANYHTNTRVPFGRDRLLSSTVTHHASFSCYEPGTYRSIPHVQTLGRVSLTIPSAPHGVSATQESLRAAPCSESGWTSANTATANNRDRKSDKYILRKSWHSSQLRRKVFSRGAGGKPICEGP